MELEPIVVRIKYKDDIKFMAVHDLDPKAFAHRGNEFKFNFKLIPIVGTEWNSFQHMNECANDSIRITYIEHKW